MELGFPINAAMIFEKILVVSKDKIDYKSLILKSSMKDAFNWLREIGVILIQTSANGNINIIPIHPVILSRSLFSRECWKFVFHQNQINTLSLDKRYHLQKYKRYCDNLETLLLKNWDKFQWAKISDQDIVYIPQEDTSTILAENILSAHQEIQGIVIPDWLPNIALVWESLVEKMRHGVEYKRISDELTWIAFGYEINKRDILEAGVNLKIQIREKIPEKFFLIDDKKCLIFSPICKNNKFNMEMTLVSNPFIINAQQQKFKEIWNKSLDALVLLKYSKKLRKEYINKIEKEKQGIKEFLMGLYDYGVFYDKIAISQKDIVELKRKSLVRYYSNSKSKLLPNIHDEILRQF